MASNRRPAKTEGNVTDIADARRQAKHKAGGSAPAKKAKSQTESNRRFNHEKVASIKAAIVNGSYTINAKRIADKFIEKESL